MRAMRFMVIEHFRAGQAHLREAGSGRPVADTESRLGVRFGGGIAHEKKIGGAQLHGRLLTGWRGCLAHWGLRIFAANAAQSAKWTDGSNVASPLSFRQG